MSREELQRETPEQEPKPVRDRVPFKQKISWAGGSIADQFLTNGINSLTLPIYNISLGVSPVLLGYGLAIPRLFDAITDPIMGNISDNTRSRWGRRRPYILIGAVLSSFTFMLLWMPPSSLGHTGLFVYFTVLAILMYGAFTIFAVPRQALGYELSTDYNERTNLFAWNALLATVAGVLIPWMYKLSFHPLLAGPERNELVGVRSIAIIAAAICLLTALPCAFFTRERYNVAAQPKIKFVKAAKMTLANKPFLMISGVIVLILLAVGLVGPMNLYINIYYVCGGDKELGAFWGGIAGTVQAIVGGISTPIIAWIANRAGKRKTIMGGLALAICSYLASWWLFDPQRPWLQVFFNGTVQPALMTVWVLNGSIIADICDDDELRNGYRREGMFGAIFTFITKAAPSGIVVLMGYVLLLAGFREGQEVTPDTVRNLRVLFIVIPVVLLSFAIVLAQRFPITEAIARWTRAQLDERHAKHESPVEEEPLTEKE